MVLREFPDFLARRPGGADAARREALLARWQTENVIVGARVRYAHFGPFVHGLSVKAAWNGREHYYVGARRIAVDDDTYLILNEGRSYASAILEHEPVDTFSVSFRPGLAGEVLAALAAPVHRQLDESTASARPAPAFAEHLRPHDATVTPVLREILALVHAGVDDEMRYEELLHVLLERMLRAEHEFRRGAASFAAARGTTRVELYRRVMLAADFIHSCYTRPICLDEIAAAARLSKFYLVRLFAAVHGLPPHGFLLRKRVNAARRLLAAGVLDVNEIAEATGLGSRWSLYRQLRKQLGAHARGLRGRSGRLAERICS